MVNKYLESIYVIPSEGTTTYDIRKKGTIFSIAPFQNVMIAHGVANDPAGAWRCYEEYQVKYQLATKKHLLIGLARALSANKDGHLIGENNNPIDTTVIIEEMWNTMYSKPDYMFYSEMIYDAILRNDKEDMKTWFIKMMQIQNSDGRRPNMRIAHIIKQKIGTFAFTDMISNYATSEQATDMHTLLDADIGL